MEKWDIIIIGGGPAGLFAACSLPKTQRVLLLEKNEQVGKKLLVSGSGQCNLTHSGDILDFFPRFNQGGRFVRRALSLFSNAMLMEFFTSRGLRLVVREDGKVFPESLKARDVLDLLLERIEKLGHEIHTHEAVRALEQDPECGFVVRTDRAEYTAESVLVATGGITYPALGSTGDGQDWAEHLGHRVVAMHGGLSPVRSREVQAGDLSGIVLSGAAVSLLRGGKKAGEYHGELLFTHRGLSGPVVIDHSRDFAQGDVLRIDLGLDLQQLNPRKSLLNALTASMPERLARHILDRIGIGGQETLSSLRKEPRKALETLLHALDFSIDEVGRLEDSMVTCGGVGFSDVSVKTLESRLAEGLYFAGEVLDIDGESGGYNLQAAFSTGALVARSILDKITAKKNTQ